MYNSYRRRSYSISKSKARDYANEMVNLKNSFNDLAKTGWSISSHLDSCYKDYGKFELRLSNHSASYAHNVNDGYLIVNIKKSKLEFVSFINNDLDDVLPKIKKLNLNKYRFVNIVNSNINCYVKGFKTKKDVFQL